MFMVPAAQAWAVFMSAAIVSTAPTAWPRHHVLDGRLQFSCPTSMVVTTDSNCVTIEHSVPFRHIDPCDRSRRHELACVVDFHVVLRLDPRNEIAVIKSEHPDAVRPRLAEREIYGNDSLLIDPEQTPRVGYVYGAATDSDRNWIRRGEIGAFSGHRLRSAAGDCDSQTYYFFCAVGTLIAERELVAALGQHSSSTQKIRSLPGVIAPEREKEIFDGIIESIAIVGLAPGQPGVLNAADGRLDHVPPMAPTVRLVGIERGYGAYGNGEILVSDSESREGGVSLYVRGTDNRTPSDSLRYRLRLADGDLPHGFTLPLRETQVNGGRLRLSWSDGKSWTQEPFSFRLTVTAIDLAGNEGAPSEAIVVAHDGDMTDRKQQLVAHLGSTPLEAITEYIDGDVGWSFDVVFHPDDSALTVEEYALPDGEKLSAKFMRRFEHTFLARAQARRQSYRSEPPIVRTGEYQPGKKEGAFSLADEKYSLAVSRRGMVSSDGDSLATLTVRRNDEVVFESEVGYPISCQPVVSFFGWTHGNALHWTLEYWRHVVVDGVDLGARDGFSETFFYRFVRQKPFYFGKSDGGVRPYWNGHAVRVAYDEIAYAPLCGQDSFDPVTYEGMVCFYARRGPKWYYVEAGVFDH
jgi:hypothetical protein